MTKLFRSLLFFSTVLHTSCSEKEFTLPKDSLIIHGTSFGQCIGPCVQELSINSIGKVRYQVNYRRPEKNFVFIDSIGTSCFSEIKENYSPSTINSLPDKIGCPDCSDGGSEWVGIVKQEQIEKKVVFEYGNAPEAIEKLVNLLRTQKEALSEKYLSKP